MTEQEQGLARASLIDQVYASQGWREVFAPFLTERKRALELALRNPSLARKYNMPDDYIRGRLDMIEEILDRPRQMAEIDRNAAVEEILAQKREEEYDLRSRVGPGYPGLADFE